MQVYIYNGCKFGKFGASLGSNLTRYCLRIPLVFAPGFGCIKFLKIPGSVSKCRPHPVRVKKRPPSCVNFGGFQAHSKTGWFSWVFTHPKTFRHGRFSSGAGPLPEPRAARNTAFAYHSFAVAGFLSKSTQGGRDVALPPWTGRVHLCKRCAWRVCTP